MAEFKKDTVKNTTEEKATTEETAVLEANAEETFKFTSSVVGGAIPKEYIPAVGAGIEEASKTGVLGGFPVLGVWADVYDGSYPVSYTHLDVYKRQNRGRGRNCRDNRFRGNCHGSWNRRGNCRRGNRCCWDNRRGSWNRRDNCRRRSRNCYRRHGSRRKSRSCVPWQGYRRQRRCHCGGSLQGG